MTSNENITLCEFIFLLRSTGPTNLLLQQYLREKNPFYKLCINPEM